MRNRRKGEWSINHKTVKVPFGEELIDIDVKLAPLLPLLWDWGIETVQCCQEYRPGESCIEFPGTAEVEDFLFRVQKDYKVELETRNEAEGGGFSIRVRLLVFFPTKDIPRLVKALAVDLDATEKPNKRRKAQGRK